MKQITCTAVRLVCGKLAAWCCQTSHTSEHAGVVMNSEEPASLEYIEDPYFNPNDSTATPSLDDLEGSDTESAWENELELFDLRQLDFDDLNVSTLPSLNDDDESVNVEAEFFNVKRANAIIRAFLKNRFKRQVRVTYCDLTKPYLAKLPENSNFRRYLDLTGENNNCDNNGRLWLDEILLELG